MKAARPGAATRPPRLLPLRLLGAALVGLGFTLSPAQAASPPTLAAPSSDAGAPASGRHAGELCVQTGDGAAQCGPAELDFRAGRLRIQVSDIAYRLRLRSSQADVVLMHGAVQIDEFVADYRWLPQGLQFADSEKGVRYEVRWVGKKR